MTANPLVLVINSGSSSLKYQLIDPHSDTARAGGGIQQIGEPSSRVADHEEALRLAFAQLSEAGVDLQSCGLLAVGHRVVHGVRTSTAPRCSTTPGSPTSRSCLSLRRCTIRPRCRASK